MPAPDDVELRIRTRIAQIKADKRAFVKAETYLQDVEALSGLLQIAIERLQRIAAGENVERATTRVISPPQPRG